MSSQELEVESRCVAMVCGTLMGDPLSQRPSVGKQRQEDHGTMARRARRCGADSEGKGRGVGGREGDVG